MRRVIILSLYTLLAGTHLAQYYYPEPYRRPPTDRPYGWSDRSPRDRGWYTPEENYSDRLRFRYRQFERRGAGPWRPY